MAHRDSTFWTLFETQWQDPADDEANIGWLRDLYGAVFAATGGVPVTGDRTPRAATSTTRTRTSPTRRSTASGVPASTLYHGANYPLLQRIKAAYDPHDVFRHAQSVRGV